MEDLRRMMCLAAMAIFCSVACGPADADPEVAGEGKVGSDSFTVEYVIEPSPPQVGANEILLHIEDESGDAVTGASIVAQAWMEAHGHGSESPPAVMEVGEGDYHVMDLVLQMPGVWTIEVEITAGETTESVEIELDIK